MIAHILGNSFQHQPRAEDSKKCSFLTEYSITLTEKYNLVHNLKGIVPRDILIYSAFRTQPRMVTGQNDFEKFCEFAYLHFLLHIQ